MTAFEEFGVLSELGKAIDEMDWNLPTDVQAEAIPLILGGGDVLMAAETGSGKTGAFCLPILQIVWETLKDIQEGKTSKVISPVSTEWTMSLFDRTDALAVTPDGLRCQSRDQNGWHGCRATKGVHTKGAYYYEATVTDEGLCRVGWSTQAARLDLGTDSLGYGFGGTGKKSNAKNFEDYGKAYGKNDVIGCYLNLNNGDISYTVNGEDMGVAFKLNQSRRCDCYFPAIVLKNAEMSFNFGSTPFKYPPTGEYIGIAKASKDCVKQNIVSAVACTGAKQVNNAPQAIIIEPSRELAEQTCNQITLFKKYLDNPKVRELLVVGGINVKDQINQLNSGVDIVVGTPGRLEDLIQGGYLALTHCRFFVLDEADGLLKAGCGELIERLHRQIPKITSDGRRLQMVVCSATLHAFEVKKMAEKLMHFPTWVDLKGEDAVPETVHHVVVNVDPQRDRGWETQRSLVERVSHPSSAQVEALVSFLEDRPTLAKGLMKNRNAKARAIKEWEKISAILNCSCGGTIKSRQKWMKYWSDKKNAVKKKCAARNAARLGTGDGAEEVPELSEIEERILALMRGGGLGGSDEPQLKVFDDNVNDTDIESKMPIKQSPVLSEPSSEITRQECASVVRHDDNTSTTSTSKRRTFRTVKRSPPTRRPQFSSIADKFLKLEDQRLAHEGRVVKLIEEMARTHSVLAEGVRAQAEAQRALGEGLKVLGEGLKSLAESMKIQIMTDGVHAKDNIRSGNTTPETLSEAVKILKGEYCVRAIREHKMDRAIIFCRTKLDCDNLERYLKSFKNEFSCVCLHGDRKPAERKANLEQFKQKQVKFLICTDVAARGIDISGLPFMINVTLPDEKSNYVHRIGRVGRAERMGLAISLVSTVPEKVWYHGEWCSSRGRNCWNTNLIDDRPKGCCMWYNEPQYLADIEDHLNITIQQIETDMKVPCNEFDGKVVYGQKRTQVGSGYQDHVTQMAPVVRSLQELESQAQLYYLKMHHNVAVA